MHPITGPHVTVKGSLSGQSYQRIVSYRQAKPFDLPLRLESERLTVWKKFWPSDNAATYSGERPGESALYNEAYSKAYAKVVDGLLGERTQLAATLATYRQSMSMIETRALQLRDMVIALRKGRLGLALTILGHPQGRRKNELHHSSRNLASQILEVSYGWVPLAQDIQGSLAVLESPIPTVPLRGRGRSRVLSIEVPPPPYDPEHLLFLSSGYSQRYDCKVTCGVEVRMTNPNLALATALGLTDPMEVLYEITPWSFVLDWFSNAQQFLTSWNDFMGFTLTNPFVTSLHVSTDSFMSNRPDWYPPGFGTSVRVKRSLGLHSPLPYWKPIRISARRALNAISLLVQQLPRHKA